MTAPRTAGSASQKVRDTRDVICCHAGVMHIALVVLLMPFKLHWRFCWCHHTHCTLHWQSYCRRHTHCTGDPFDAVMHSAHCIGGPAAGVMHRQFNLFSHRIAGGPCTELTLLTATAVSSYQAFIFPNSSAVITSRESKHFIAGSPGLVVARAANKPLRSLKFDQYLKTITSELHKYK